MFENTIAYKRMLKKNKMLDELEKAKAESDEWKVRQLEGRIAEFDRKFYPNVIWNDKGTYRKKGKRR